MGRRYYLFVDQWRWLYLAVIIDLFSRQVLSWSMSERMTADLVCDAVRMTIFKRKRPKNVIVHSGRGSQYCSHVYRQLLLQHDLLGSMSAKGNCYDNACAESFFHSLKVEAIMVNVLIPVKLCAKRCLNISKQIIIQSGCTQPMAF